MQEHFIVVEEAHLQEQGVEKKEFKTEIKYEFCKKKKMIIKHFNDE